jgi:hypothetical protein
MRSGRRFAMAGPLTLNFLSSPAETLVCCKISVKTPTLYSSEVHRLRPMTAPMDRPMRRILTIAALLALSAPPVVAADQHACLTRAEQQAAVESGKAVPLATAIQSVRGHARGRQVVKAQLCNEAKGLVYVLTVLARDGKVTHARVDAASGGMIGEL